MEEIKPIKAIETYSPTKEEYKEMTNIGEPQNMLEVRAVANFLSKSKFIPASFRGDLNTAVMLVITCKQYGLPITALSEVMEVNGKVGFWGRTKLGIILKSPVCEYIMPIEQTDKVCIIEAKRKGYPKAVQEKYTIEQAEKAGLIQRSDAWKKHPADMLYWRAISRVISKVFPDVIQGFSTVEEMEEEQPKATVAVPQAITVEAVKETPKKIKAVKETPKVKEQEPTIEEVEEVFAEEEVPAEVVEPEIVEQAKPEKESRFFRFIKRVAILNGVRYCACVNPLDNEEEKYSISSALVASELKKLTGTQVWLHISDGVINSFEEQVE